jgi:hypothetical protein
VSEPVKLIMPKDLPKAIFDALMDAAIKANETGEPVRAEFTLMGCTVTLERS